MEPTRQLLATDLRTAEKFVYIDALRRSSLRVQVAALYRLVFLAAVTAHPEHHAARIAVGRMAQKWAPAVGFSIVSIRTLIGLAFDLRMLTTFWSLSLAGLLARMGITESTRSRLSQPATEAPVVARRIMLGILGLTARTAPIGSDLYTILLLLESCFLLHSCN
jgi:hypothetical protein